MTTLLASPTQEAAPPRSFRIRRATPADIPRLADIHAVGMPADFLVRLGGLFQTRVFFPTLLASPDVRIYVAEADEAVLGFLITRLGFGGVVTEMLRGRPAWFVAACAAAVLRRPTLLKQAVGIVAQLRARGDEPELCGTAELFLMAVAAAARRRGVGRALIEHSAACLRSAGVQTYRVLLHAGNAPANRLYAETGFVETRLFNFGGQLWRERALLLAPAPADGPLG